MRPALMRTALAELVGIKHPVVQAAMGYVSGPGLAAVIATGGEGGGHVGAVPTSLLMPQVAAAVDLPVIAAGGFFDGRGLVAALAWGAAGIAMGTWFLLTSDSPVSDAVKQLYLAAGLDGTVVTRQVDGTPLRMLRTTMVDRLEEAGTGARAGTGAAGPGGPLRADQIGDLLRAAMVDGRTDLGLMSSGQVTGLIGDLPSCAELLERIMSEAGRCLDQLDETRKA